MTRTEVKHIIQRLAEQQGRFPMIQDIATALNVMAYRVPPILKVLVDEGWLLRVGNNYRLAPTGPLPPDEIPGTHVQRGTVSAAPNSVPPASSPPAPVAIPEAIPTALPLPSTPMVAPAAPIQAKPDSSLTVLRWVLLFIGVGAIIGSTYYTGIWMSESNPGWLAWLLSAIMVTFSTAAFDFIVALLSGTVTRHWCRFLIAGGFFVLWLVVITFSIGSTIAGQYNRHAHQLGALRGSVEEQNQSATLTRLNSALVAAEASQKSAQAALDSLIRNQPQVPTDLKELAQYRTTFNNVQDAIKAQQGAVQQAQASVGNARQLLEAFVAQNPKAQAIATAQVPDFYAWIARTFHTDKDQVQFWLNLFPAVFLDLIAPAAIAIFLFMRKREEV